METKGIFNKNRLIAAFHGWDIGLVTSPNDPWSYHPATEELEKLAGKYPMLMSHQLRYHESWDWLMPVIKKIEGMGHPVEICGNTCSIYEHADKRGSVLSISAGDKLFATYNNVLQFIEVMNLYNSKATT